MAAACEFDRLIKRNVPHILEKIFLSLDSKSFMNCFEVSKSWNDLLTSESFQRKGKPIFSEDLEEKLQKAADEGNSDEVRKILSSGLVDINSINEMEATPCCWLHRKATKMLSNSSWIEGLSQTWQIKMEALHYTMLH